MDRFSAIQIKNALKIDFNIFSYLSIPVASHGDI
jgi:hypothetical protein